VAVLTPTASANGDQFARDGPRNELTILREIHFRTSGLGLLYSAFTYYCGLSVNSGEYKPMGSRLTGRRDSPH
jgi:predicted NodU family carbamoyl transferase